MIRSDPFRELSALKRKRRIANSLYGGRGIGQPNRTGLVGAQQPISRGAGRPSTGGGSSITTGPEQTPPEQEGLLGGILQAKGAYEGVKEAATGGKNIRKKFDNFNGRDYLDDMSLGYDRLMGNQPDARLLDSELRRLTGGSGEVPTSPNMTGRLGESFGPQPMTRGAAAATGPAPVNNISQLQSMDPRAALDAAPKFFKGTQVAQGSNLSTGAQGILGSGAGGVQSAAGGLANVPTGTSAVNPGSITLNTGGATSVTKDGAKAVSGLKSPPTQGVDTLGAAGAGLGVGLNAYDISQNGINFANATGLAGSAVLGATALGFGAANFWNPIGWTLLGASAADQIFDIF